MTMKALENINRLNYRNEDVRKIIKLYTYKGKEFYYESILAPDMASIKKSLVAIDSYFLMVRINLLMNYYCI